eukprot:2611544-Pyramimonas_sp.AAC.4
MVLLHRQGWQDEQRYARSEGAGRKASINDVDNPVRDSFCKAAFYCYLLLYAESEDCEVLYLNKTVFANRHHLLV